MEFTGHYDRLAVWTDQGNAIAEAYIGLFMEQMRISYYDPAYCCSRMPSLGAQPKLTQQPLPLRMNKQGL